MNLIILGPPGAGKGTQANRIAKIFNLKQVSTGELLRNEVKSHSDLGKKIESFVNMGKLVSDEIVNSFIEKIISVPNNFNRLIFDGYPRNFLQIQILDELLKQQNQKISAILSLEVDKDIITKRIIGRIICTKCFKTFNEFFNPPSEKKHTCGKKYLQKRNDDKLETILNRFETYVLKTKPVLEHYKKKDFFYKINGNNEIDEIYNKIKDILENIRD